MALKSIRNVEKDLLIDKLEYYMSHSQDERSMAAMFTEEEINILHTIKEFEQLRGIMEKERSQRKNGDTDNAVYIEEVFRRREQEMDISFRLKRQFVCQADLLLSGERVENWVQVSV